MERFLRRKKLLLFKVIFIDVKKTFIFQNENFKMENSSKSTVDLSEAFVLPSKTKEKELTEVSVEIKRDKISKRFIGVLKDNLTCEMYHAFLEVFDSQHYIIKLHLALFLIVSYGLASYMTIQLIMSYFNYGVTTTIRTIYETPSMFPQVTICNLNPFTTKKAFDYLKSIDTDGLLNSMANMSFYQKDQNYYKILFKTGGLLKNETNAFKQSLGHSLDDILIKCKFNHGECSAKDFSWTWDNYYGNCFSFNSGLNSSGHKSDLRHSDLSGYPYGLAIDVYVGFYEQLSFLNSFASGRGAFIKVLNATHKIGNDFTEGVFASSGMATKIAIKREIKSMLPQPYSDCIIDKGKDLTFDSFLYNLIKNSIYDYTQQFCFQQCLQQLIINTCGCVLSVITSLFDTHFCDSLNEIQCAIGTFINVYGKNDYATSNCVSKCPLECNSTQITYATSFYDLIGDTYVDYIRNNPNLSLDFVNKSINAETAKQSVVRLLVYYDSLSYSQIDEAPQIDLVALIANIGGNLGLFLGVSLFSLCEIITTLLEIYFYKKDSVKTTSKIF
jgi:hypothetical protein